MAFERAAVKIIHGEEKGMKLDIAKNWRILLMVSAVIVALILINPLPKSGALVASVPSDSPFNGKVNVGETITWANEKPINSPEDFYSFENFTGNLRFMHDGKLTLVNLDRPGLDIVLTAKPKVNLQLGLDLVGGTRVLLQPKGNVSDDLLNQIVATLETRVNIFGLKEAKFQPVKDISGNSYVQIEMAGGSQAEIETLLSKQGKFEGKIDRIVALTNGTGSMLLNGNSLPLIMGNQSITLRGTKIALNQTVKIDGVDVQYINSTSDNALVLLTAFTGTDIQSVCLQDQSGVCTSRVVKSGNGYEFDFQVFITQAGAERFANLTNDMKIVTDPSGGGSYLDGKINLFLDEKIVTSLSISADLKGKAYTTPAITGFRTTRAEALQEQLMLKSILQSGSLPTSLEIIRVDQVSPNLGGEFFQGALLAAIIAEIAVAIVIFARYREVKILVQMMTWSFSELIITLGVAVLIKQTIDLSAIAGIIAAIGTGTNDQIIMIDEMLSGGNAADRRSTTVKQRIKRSFFIIFGAAGTVFAAMIPMMFIGVGVMRGFAIVTTIGILTGVLITRPAFPIIAEKLLGRNKLEGIEVKKPAKKESAPAEPAVKENPSV
jgi:protein-export membrane protein SecD